MEVCYSIAARLAGGGIGTTAYQAVLGIHRHGYLKTVFCDSYNLSKVRPLRGLDPQATHASLMEKIPVIPQPYQWLIKDNLHDFLVSQKLPKCDIFHGWNGHCLRSLRRARDLGAVGVVERASSHPLTYEKLLREEYRKWGLRIDPIHPWTKNRLLTELEKTDFITVPSPFAYQSMTKNGVPKEKLVMLPFGVDVKKFKVQKAKRKTKTQSLKFTALFVGQVGIRKGALYLLEAWKKLSLRDAELVLLGEVEPDASKILDLKSLKSVKFKGYKDPLPFYQEADVFVFPSLEEGSALVTYEALACGLPVITTFNSGSVVEDGKEGFIIPIRDAKALAERIRFLYDNENIRLRMSRAAREKAEQYTWTDYGERLVRFYEQVKN